MANTKFFHVWSHIGKTLKEFGELISPYITGAGSDKLAAGDRKVTLTDNEGTANLTFNPGTVYIETSGSGSDLYIRSLSGDDIILESGDDIRLRGDQGLYDDEADGGDIFINAGTGSDGDNADAGIGGDIRLQAGSGGTSLNGDNAVGGVVSIVGGFSTNGTNGGSVFIYGGQSSGPSKAGSVVIGDNFTWRFNENDGTLLFSAVTLATLPNPVGVPGARAMIADSSVAASTNFGAIAATGGSNIVPVFSNGTNWLIG